MATINRIAVTGGSGMAGRACIADLIEHGYKVLNIDTAPPRDRKCPFISAQLTDFGQAIDAITGVDFGAPNIDAIVHLAAVPSPRRMSNAVTFANNITSTYNVFEAARRLGIKNIVWASSTTVLGLPFDKPPAYFPLDEQHPSRPETAYALTKLLGEQMAEQFCRWDPHLKIFALRFSFVNEPHRYAKFAEHEHHSLQHNRDLWGYVDVRDAAQAIRKSLECEAKGADVFIIAGKDTMVSIPSSELIANTFPSVPVNKELKGTDTLLSIEKSRRILGYEPQYSWHDPSSWVEAK